MSGFCFVLCTLYNLKPFITTSSKRTSKKKLCKTSVRCKNKQLHEYGLLKNCTQWNAGLLVPKGLATGQHKAFPPFSLHKMLSWGSKSTMQCILLMQGYQHELQNTRPNTILPTLSKFQHSAALQTQHSA